MDKKVLLGAGVMALSLAFLAGPADAAKKGPRASLAAATVCEVVGDNFNVTIRLDDISSGNEVPLVTAWTIVAKYKDSKGKWDDQVEFGAAAGGPEADLSDITWTFDISGLPPEAKAVNAFATIYYVRASDGLDLKTIENRCGDDPDTEVVEPDGVML